MTDTLVTDARAFLAELAANNTRDWFLDHKAAYEDRLKAPAMALLDRLSGPLAGRAGAPVTTKLFRPNRDVRFSKDKTPYHLHLHMLWAVDGTEAAWFFGISPDYVTAGAGIMGFAKDSLARFRDAVDADPDAWLAEVAALEARGYDFREPDLKRVPPAYPQDHPAAVLLRRKGLAAWTDIAGAPLEADLMAAFEALTPLVRRLATL